jgi:transposase
MRRTHLRGHTNILTRLLIHAGEFNLWLVMRALFGIGAPRRLQGRRTSVVALLTALWTDVVGLWRDFGTATADHSSGFVRHHYLELLLPVSASQ